MELSPILIVDIIIFTGFILGDISLRLGLPKVTGYIIAGIVLNPGLLPVVPQTFVNQASIVTHIALAFITFSVGGTLSFTKIRAQGKTIVSITFLKRNARFCSVLYNQCHESQLFGHDGQFTGHCVFCPCQGLR